MFDLSVNCTTMINKRQIQLIKSISWQGPRSACQHHPLPLCFPSWQLILLELDSLSSGDSGELISMVLSSKCSPVAETFHILKRSQGGRLSPWSYFPSRPVDNNVVIAGDVGAVIRGLNGNGKNIIKIKKQKKTIFSKKIQQQCC